MGNEAGPDLGGELRGVGRVVEDTHFGPAILGNGGPRGALQYIKVLVPVLVKLKVCALDVPAQAVVQHLRQLCRIYTCMHSDFHLNTLHEHCMEIGCRTKQSDFQYISLLY